MSEVKGLRYVVMGIRHFMNNEHHWLVGRSDDAEAFAEDGEVVCNTDRLVDTPAFTSLKDAERYAMHFATDEYTLAQWEKARPTWYVVEEDSYHAIVEKDNYSYPKEAETWSDAKTADFEREEDCEDIVNLALWDSETDEERFGEKALNAVYRLNDIEGMRAWVVEDGLIAVEDKEYTIDGIRDFVDNLFAEGELGCEAIEFDHDLDGKAYFNVR